VSCRNAHAGRFQSLGLDIRVANDAAEIGELRMHHIGEFGATGPGRIEANVSEFRPLGDFTAVENKSASLDVVSFGVAPGANRPNHTSKSTL
jgi:hypothetical protein